MSDDHLGHITSTHHPTDLTSDNACQMPSASDRAGLTARKFEVTEIDMMLQEEFIDPANVVVFTPKKVG